MRQRITVSRALGALVAGGLRRCGRDVRATLVGLARGGVSAPTVRRMQCGWVPEDPRDVLALALALGDDPDPYLRACEFPFRYDRSQISNAKSSP